MPIEDTNSSSHIVLFSHDKRLAQTRQWVLEQAGLHLMTVHTLADLDAVAALQQATVFLLCNTLSAELRTETVTHIRNDWMGARILIFMPSQPMPELPADEFFYSAEGPRHLIEKIQRLLPAMQV